MGLLQDSFGDSNVRCGKWPPRSPDLRYLLKKALTSKAPINLEESQQNAAGIDQESLQKFTRNAVKTVNIGPVLRGIFSTSDTNAQLKY
jgi:hypothetical protein